MMAKLLKTLELHYPMIQILIIAYMLRQNVWLFLRVDLKKSKDCNHFDLK